MSTAERNNKRNEKSNLKDNGVPGTRDRSTDAPLIFRISSVPGNRGPSLLRKTLLEAGMIEFDPKRHAESQWNLWWKAFRFKRSEYAQLSSTQRVNHHPAPMGNQTDITKKDGLLRAVRRLCAAHPKCSKLIRMPLSFNLPREENQFFRAFCENITKEKKNARNIWIVKPSEMSRGRGIYLFDHLEHCVYRGKSVVQRYITNPLLIEGYKFDLRLYAVVPSYAPFIVYLFADGLVRFATEPFDLDNLKNVFSHLTNSSINVNGPSYMSEKSGIGRGCKWSVTKFRQWLAQHGVDDAKLWVRIKTMIILTLLSQATDTMKTRNAYEVLGFDILIDDELKPWLLEVNANPSLSNDCITDEQVKKPLVRSVLHMLQFNDCSNISQMPCRSLSLNATPIQLLNHSFHKSSSTRNTMTEQAELISRGEAADSKKSSRNSDSENNDRIGEGNAGLLAENFHADLRLFTERAGESLSRSNQSTASTEVTHTSCNASQQNQFLFQGSLYGQNSGLLLSQLKFLSQRFPASGQKPQSHTSTKFTRSEDCFQIRSLNDIDGLMHLKRKDLETTHVGNGSFLIPHSFGKLKLIFPFNLATRIACAKESHDYPDKKMIIQQLALLVHSVRNGDQGNNEDHTTITDIPDLWS